MNDHTNVTRRGFVQSAAAGMAGLGLASMAGTVAFAEEEVSAEAGAADEVGLRQHSAQLNPQGTFAPIANAQTPSIFTEWQFGSMTLPNRIVKSAAGYIGVTSQGIDAPLFLDYLAGLAKGGVSLLYTDDFVELYDHFKAGEEVGKIADWTPEQLANIAATVHDNGGKIGYQLATMGLIYSGFEPDPTAIFQTSTCMDMTAQEIQDLIADTIKAATILKDAGFDCVEINAAGENTGQTFMSRARNQRDDEYGPQTFESRTRFVCEIVSGIKEACGADFPVQVLINGVEENDKNIGDSELYTTVEDNKEMCKLIEAAGADALHVRIGPRGQHVAEFAGDLFFTGYGIEGTTSYGTQFDFTRHWQGMLKADQSGMGVMTKVAAERRTAVSTRFAPARAACTATGMPTTTARSSSAAVPSPRTPTASPAGRSPAATRPSSPPSPRRSWSPAPAPPAWRPPSSPPSAATRSRCTRRTATSAVFCPLRRSSRVRTRTWTGCRPTMHASSSSRASRS